MALAEREKRAGTNGGGAGQGLGGGLRCWDILFLEDPYLSRISIAFILLALTLTAGCKAQPSATNPADLEANRRIEVMIRSKFSVPADYTVTLGTRTPSTIPGYEKLPVTLTRGAKTAAFDFLISSDGKTLARLETFDLSKNPALAIDTAGRPIRGNPNAKVTVINFDDLECPYCARMHEALFPSTLERYKDKVRFIYKDYPLTEIHPWAMHAAVDANCLAAQNSDVYWTYVDYLHAHGQEITGPDRDAKKSFEALDRIARQEGTVGKLDGTKLDACLAKQDESQIQASMKEGEELDIDATPALFIDGEKIVGALPAEQVWAVIDRALKAEGEQPPAPAATPQNQGAKGAGK